MRDNSQEVQKELKDQVDAKAAELATAQAELEAVKANLEETKASLEKALADKEEELRALAEKS